MLSLANLRITWRYAQHMHKRDGFGYPESYYFQEFANSASLSYFR